MTAPNADQMLEILYGTVLSLVRRDGKDLSARQLGVFLICYLQDGDHTVRGLAQDLKLSKPPITRALDRLAELDLARRKVDPRDRRSVLVHRTAKGNIFLRELKKIMGETAGSTEQVSVANCNHRRLGSQSSAGRAQNHCNGSEGSDPQSLQLGA